LLQEQKLFLQLRPEIAVFAGGRECCGQRRRVISHGVGPDHAHGREDAGIARHQDATDAHSLGQLTGVQGTGTTEGNQREV
jgi:hypothetical protein